MQLSGDFFIDNILVTNTVYGVATMKHFEKHFNKTAELQTSIGTKNNFNEEIENWTTIKTFDGTLRPLSGDSGSKAKVTEKDGKISTHRFYCYPISEIPKDKNSRLIIDGLIYRVIFAADVMNKGVLMQIDLELIK